MQRPAKSRSHHLALDRIDYGNRGRRTGWVAPAHVGRDSDGRDNIRDYFLTPSRLSMSESHRRDRNYDENADFNRPISSGSYRKRDFEQEERIRIQLEEEKRAMIHEQRLHEEMLLRQSILDQELEERRLDRRDRDDSEDEIETNAIRNSIARKSANLKNRLSLVDELRASSYVNEYNSPRRVSRSVIPEDRHSLSHNDIDSYENDRYDHRANSVIGSSFSKSRRESFIDDLPRQTRKSLIEDDFRRQSNSRKSLVLDDFPRQSFSRKSFTNDVAQRDSYAKLDEVRKSILNAREIEDSPIKIRNITDDESISVDEQPNDDQHSILSRYEHSINDHDNQVDDGIMNSPVSEKELPVVILKKKGKRVVESDESENEVPKMKRKENRKKVTVAPRGRSRSVSVVKHETVVRPEITDNGNRQSRRAKIAPVKWWDNESIKYKHEKIDGKGVGLSVISEVIRVEEHSENIRPFPKKKNKKTSNVIENTIDDSMFQEDIQVKNIETGEMEDLRLVIPQGMIKYNTTETAFSYAKTHEITSTKSSSTGFMMLGVGGDKPNRNTKGNTLCFVVVTGQVEVLIHKSTVVCGVGTQFNVPSGNQYRLCNKGDVECRLFWVCFSPK